MASTSYDTYHHAGTGEKQSTERVIWVLVAVVLFLLVFTMGSRTDVEQMTQMVHRSSKTLAQSQVGTAQSGANGANYALMRTHR
ncbi:MAG: hypothetical protein C5B53_02325 [Candidatus Melainabacteria bacterium]|nr:MAG: hypothetical protein C5B53_02325 [Candidatus Melainabacteria bacterium]